MSAYEIYQLIGTFIFIMGTFNLARALVKRRWPETLAIIQKNKVEKITSSLFSPLRTGSLSDFSAKSYAGTDKENVLRLSHVYAVDGVKYIGNQLYSAAVFKVRGRIVGIGPQAVK